MPKVTCYQPKPIPADYIGDMFRRYRKANGITAAQLGKAIGCAESTVRDKQCRGCERFTLADFKSWCKGLNIPAEDAAKAIRLYLEQ